MGAVLFVTIGMLVFDIYGSYIPLTAFYLLWMFLGFSFLSQSKITPNSIVLGIIIILPIAGIFKTYHYPGASLLFILTMLTFLISGLFFIINEIRAKTYKSSYLAIGVIILFQLILRVSGASTNNDSWILYGDYLNYFLVAILGTIFLKSFSVKCIKEKILFFLLINSSLFVIMKFTTSVLS